MPRFQRNFWLPAAAQPLLDAAAEMTRTIRLSLVWVLALSNVGCAFVVQHPKKSAQAQQQQLLFPWMAAPEEAEPVVHEQVKLAIPWADAQPEVKKRLEGLGMRAHGANPNRIRFTQPVDEEALLVVDVSSGANGRETRVLIQRLLESDASFARAAKVKRTMQQLGRAPNAAAPTATASLPPPAPPAAAPPTTAPPPPPAPPAAAPPTTAPLPPPLPPAAPPPATPVKPLSAPSSVGDAVERPLAPGVTPPPSSAAPPSPKPPSRGRRGSKSAPR